MDINYEIARNIILAQAASDSGKYRSSIIETRGTSKMGYAVKPIYIKRAIDSINSTRRCKFTLKKKIKMVTHPFWFTLSSVWVIGLVRFRSTTLLTLPIYFTNTSAREPPRSGTENLGVLQNAVLGFAPSTTFQNK